MSARRTSWQVIQWNTLKYLIDAVMYGPGDDKELIFFPKLFTLNILVTSFMMS